MITLDKLEEIKERTLESAYFNKDRKGTRVVVGMATCGIAAGADPVLASFLDEVKNRNLKNITVTKTGCIGVCRLEPMAEVYMPGKEKVTYVNMTPEKVKRVVAEHLVNGLEVHEFTIGAAD